jgi:hypothetical protein
MRRRYEIRARLTVRKTRTVSDSRLAGSLAKCGASTSRQRSIAPSAAFAVSEPHARRICPGLIPEIEAGETDDRTTSNSGILDNASEIPH